MASASAASEAKKPTPRKKKKRQSKGQNVSDSSDESDDDDDDDDDDDEEEVHGGANAANATSYRDAVRDRAAHDEVPRADGQFGGYTSDDLEAVIALHPQNAIFASYALLDRQSVKMALRRREASGWASLG